MTVTVGIPPDNWPSYPDGKPMLSNGDWQPHWSIFLQNMVMYAQRNLSSEGHVMPNQTADNITAIASSTTVPNGTVWHDENNNVLKVKLNDVVRTIALV